MLFTTVLLSYRSQLTHRNWLCSCHEGHDVEVATTEDPRAYTASWVTSPFCKPCDRSAVNRGRQNPGFVYLLQLKIATDTGVVHMYREIEWLSKRRSYRRWALSHMCGKNLVRERLGACGKYSLRAGHMFGSMSMQGCFFWKSAIIL